MTHVELCIRATCPQLGIKVFHSGNGIPFQGCHLIHSEFVVTTKTYAFFAFIAGTIGAVQSEYGTGSIMSLDRSLSSQLLLHHISHDIWKRSRLIVFGHSFVTDAYFGRLCLDSLMRVSKHNVRYIALTGYSHRPALVLSTNNPFDSEF